MQIKKKSKPQLIVGHFDNILKNFQNRKDKKEVHEVIQKEGILEVFPVSHQKSHNIFELYIITQFATVIFIRYDTEKQTILDPIKVNGKVQELFQDGNYKIDQIVVGENLSTSWGGPGLTILIGQQQLLCQIRI